jgi:ribosome biogenesis GTPase / thiamine phosphate phosphatase
VTAIPREGLEGVVASGTGGTWRVIAQDGTERDAVLRGRLKKSDTGRRSDGSIRRNTVTAAAEVLKLAVGDRVRLEIDTSESAWAITEILPRTSQLARRAPGGGHGERVLAANVDQVLVMFAAAKPEPHPRMLDRFLVIAEANNLAALIVINKVELLGEELARQKFADYPKAGYPIHFTSVKQRIGLETVGDALNGRITVLSGPSGVGKSSLLNALFPGLGLRVSEISESVNKGRHTTVGAFLHPLPGDRGGAVVDTPGLREIGMWELPVAELDQCFPEFRGLREECRFADCSHIAEPNCAVRAAVERSEVSAARYDSYVKLRSEIEEEQTN